jgi:hypothetical protein
MMSNLSSKDLDFNERTHRYWIKDTKPKQYVPSVTTITGLIDKPYIPEWYSRVTTEAIGGFLESYEEDGLVQMGVETIQACLATGRIAPREAKKHGQDVGTATHQRIKYDLDPTGENPEEYKEAGLEVELALEGYYLWKDMILNQGHKIVFAEKRVLHPSGLYCGTFDLLLFKKGHGYTLVDFKTTNKSDANPLGVYPEYFMQLAAYRAAIGASKDEEFANVFDYDIVSGMLVGLGKDGSLSTVEISGEEMDEYYDTFTHMAMVLPAYRKMEKTIRKFNRDYKKSLEVLA